MSSGIAEGRRVLVAGGAGFVGSNLVRALLNQSVDQVTVVDNLLSSEESNLPSDARLDFIRGSIADDAVLAALPTDAEWVFNLATYHGNQSSIANPLADHENNLLTMLKLLERSRAFRNLDRLVYSSAGCAVAKKTFDGAESPTDEEASPSMWHDSPYSISKLVGEFYGNYYHRRHGIPFVKARFQNVYGPGEILGAGEWRGTANTVWRNVVPTFIYKALQGQTLVIDNGGIATRDFIYVADVVAGLLACAQDGAAGETYNIATGTETSIRELAELVIGITGGGNLEVGPARDWDRSGQRYGSTEKAERDLDFRAKIDLATGLEMTVAWTVENQSLIKECIARHDAAMSSLLTP